MNMLKQKHYYYRDNDNRPFITVYLVKDLESGEVARGVSICSNKDNINKKIGVKIAKGRALKALFEKKSSMPILTHLIYFANDDNTYDLLWKSSYTPTLTEFENKLLNFNKTIEEKVYEKILQFQTA